MPYSRSSAKLTFYVTIRSWSAKSEEFAQADSAQAGAPINEYVLNKDNVWLFKSHTLRPVFMSDATPPSMGINPNFLKHT
jgi:hypothetical protein